MVRNSQTEGELPVNVEVDRTECGPIYNKGIYISSDNVLLNLQLS